MGGKAEEGAVGGRLGRDSYGVQALWQRCAMRRCGLYWCFWNAVLTCREKLFRGLRMHRVEAVDAAPGALAWQRL